MTTWNTLPERHVLDAMRQAANIRIVKQGHWHVVMEDQRDAMWFLEADAAEAFADELAADLVEQEAVGDL